MAENSSLPAGRGVQLVTILPLDPQSLVGCDIAGQGVLWVPSRPRSQEALLLLFFIFFPGPGVKGLRLALAL